MTQPAPLPPKRKIFTDYETVQKNALRLAYRMTEEENFIPDVIYVPLRGGAVMGNIISEYYKLYLKNKRKRPVFYAAVIARSYQDTRQADRIMIDGWTYNPEYLRHGDRVLLVDDIFDSGRTLNFLVDILLEKGLPRSDIKIAVHDYKERPYIRDTKLTQPDYYSRHHVIEAPENDFWIHYMSHELAGLTPEERERHYLKDNPDLEKIFRVLF